MPTRNELPVPWNTWTRLGIVGILLGLITMQQVWIRDRDKTIRELQEQNATWLSKFIENKVEEGKQKRIDPKIDEVKEITDSIKTEISKP
jgi:hypothetical protein